MKHIFWLRRGVIAGRTGPDSDYWDLEQIKNKGFSAILSVNDGNAVQESQVTRLDIAYANIPMSPNAPVQAGDKEFCLENLPKAMDFIRVNMNSGPVLIHCHSGKDRTCLVLAAYLIEFEGYEVKEAINEVLKIRPIAFSAEGWMDFGLEVLEQYKIQYKQK